jgi:hypothetical protein
MRPLRRSSIITKERRTMDIVVQRYAGLSVHKDTVVARVPRPPRVRGETPLRQDPARLQVAAPHPSRISHSGFTHKRNLPRHPIRPSPRPARPRPPPRTDTPAWSPPTTSFATKSPQQARPRLLRPTPTRTTRPASRAADRTARLNRHHRAKSSLTAAAARLSRQKGCVTSVALSIGRQAGLPQSAW